MKSCPRYIGEIFNIKSKTLLITIIFSIVLVALYFVYKPSYNNSINQINNNQINNNQINNNQINNNQSNIKNKIVNLLNNGNQLLNNTNVLSDTFNDIPPIAFNDLTDEQKEIVKTHRTFFNNPTKDSITKFYNENSTSINSNLSTLIQRYNGYNDEVNNTIQEINYDLLRQLQRNYALAHKENIKRNIELQDIDNLPQRFD